MTNCVYNRWSANAMPFSMSKIQLCRSAAQWKLWHSQMWRMSRNFHNFTNVGYIDTSRYFTIMQLLSSQYSEHSIIVQRVNDYDARFRFHPYDVI